MAVRLDSDSIGAILSAEGYLNNAVRIARDSVFVDPGPRFRLGDVNLTVIQPNGEATHDRLSYYHGIIATRSGIERLKEEILAPYREKGYFFASLNAEQIEIKRDAIAPVFKIITGPPVVIEQVRFKGLSRSRPEFVEKLSGVRRGALFVREDLDRAQRKIDATGYLQNDSVPHMTPNESYSGVELLWFLSELKSNRLELGGGYLPRQAGREGSFVGRFRFEALNLFGSGRRIGLLLDRKDPTSLKIDFRYAQPFFIPDHMEVALRFSQVDYDSSFYSFTAAGELSLITRGNTRLAGGVSWNRTEPQKSSQPPSRALSGLVRLEALNLDYMPNPGNGHRLAFGLSYIRRISWPDTAATAVVNGESMFEISVDNYARLGNKFVARLNIEAHVLISSRDLIDYSEQFKLGGFGSLRGYREDQFGGRQTFLGQAELRYQPSRRLAAYLFGDIGHIYSKTKALSGRVESSGITRPGAGAGFLVGSPGIRATMEVGWGRHDRIDEGKVHFGLVTMF